MYIIFTRPFRILLIWMMKFLVMQMSDEHLVPAKQKYFFLQYNSHQVQPGNKTFLKTMGHFFEHCKPI